MTAIVAHGPPLGMLRNYQAGAGPGGNPNILQELLKMRVRVKELSEGALGHEKEVKQYRSRIAELEAKVLYQEKELVEARSLALQQAQTLSVQHETLASAEGRDRPNTVRQKELDDLRAQIRELEDEVLNHQRRVTELTEENRLNSEGASLAVQARTLLEEERLQSAELRRGLEDAQFKLERAEKREKQLLDKYDSATRDYDHAAEVNDAKWRKEKLSIENDLAAVNEVNTTLHAEVEALRKQCSALEAKSLQAQQDHESEILSIRAEGERRNEALERELKLAEEKLKQVQEDASFAGECATSANNEVTELRSQLDQLRQFRGRDKRSEISFVDMVKQSNGPVISNQLHKPVLKSKVDPMKLAEIAQKTALLQNVYSTTKKATSEPLGTLQVARKDI